MLLLVLSILAAPVLSFRSGCSSNHCDISTCPNSCVSTLPDPCFCCPFVCAAQEGEPCDHHLPCDRDLRCTHAAHGKVCTCGEDDRMICGSDGVTYGTICQYKKEQRSSNATIRHWGPCQFAPEIISGPSDKRLRVGDPLALDCEAKGFPIPVITWTFSGRDGTKKLLPSDDQLIAVQLRGGPEHLMVTSWVQIVEARASDVGFYECTAKNSHGSVSAEATVLMRR